MNISYLKNRGGFTAVPAAVLFLFFILLLVVCPLRGQALQKKSLTASDYDSFGNFLFHKPSRNGNWVGFSMFYKNGKDTLYVKNTLKNKLYSFPLGTKPDFLGDNSFVYQDADRIHILDLQNGNKKTIANVTGYFSSPDSERLVVMTKSQLTKKQSISVFDKNGKILSTIENVTSMKMGPANKKILFSIADQNLSSIGVLELGQKTKTTWIHEKKPVNFKMLTWDKKERAVSFLTEPNSGTENKKLYYYILENKSLYVLDPKTKDNFPSQAVINESAEYAITISNDFQRVFFSISHKKENSFNSTEDAVSKVEIWKSSDTYIYPFMQKSLRFKKQNRLALWYPLTGKFSELTSDELSKVMLCGNEKYAVLSDPKKYEPQFEYDAPRDFYILNLLTGEKKLLLQNKKISPSEPLPISSPEGKYINYILNDSCWIYNTASKTYTNITRRIISQYLSLTNQKNSRNFILTPVGWTANDKQIIVYDNYDIWTISPEDFNIKKLTSGREKQIQFRIYAPEKFSGIERSYDGWIYKGINFSEGILLTASGEDGRTGFYKWKKNTGEIPLVYESSYIDKLHTTDQGKKLFYQQQRFDKPPKIIFQKDKVSTTVFQSSPHQADYDWGSASLIQFQNENGTKMSALLYYPAAYNPDKKYPMIVNIYEKQTQNLYKYSLPDLENEAGFNPVVLTSQGYFVLCPDIISEKQNEGPSALKYTISATKEIIARGLVKPDKIALMGHSFGGFEVCYIITQTKIFAAAVAGAAITNIKSYYHTVDWDTGRPTMNYFIHGQLKMIQPPSEIPEIYNLNSPIEFVKNITTPLLSYAGKEDNHVDWHQTVEFHMALRRLGKKNTMLLFPNEGHTITNPINQRDLTRKIIQWFGFYLKDETPEQWIDKN